MKSKNIAVKDYISQQLDINEKVQYKIAEALGYQNHNVITLFKMGRTKVPIHIAPRLAEQLGVDKMHLMRMILKEYQPKVWDALEEVFSKSMTTDNERAILRIIHEASGGYDLKPQTEQEEKELAELVAKWKVREIRRLNLDKTEDKTEREAS